jgi:flagellar biosynthetic protein FliR
MLLVREVVTGVALGLAVALVFGAVRQAGLIIKRQMGLAVAQEIDPMSGERTEPVGLLMEMCFSVLFLAAGGHRLMLRLVARSYEVFPIGQAPTAGAMAEAIIDAGVVMLTFALKLAAPMLGAFLVLAVVLAILARILPEMNILLASLPLRIGLGLFVAAAIMPSLNAFTIELGDWLNRFLVT